MHDSVQIEAEGTPSTVLITEPFQGLASGFAVTLGIPGYHNAFVPHPISSKDEVTLRRYADRVVDTIAQQLTADA